MTEDLDELDEDERIVAERRPEPTAFVRPERPCPMPGECRWTGRICDTCGRKRRPDAETVVMMDLARELEAGMPVARHELAAEQWQIAGSVRRRLHPPRPF